MESCCRDWLPHPGNMNNTRELKKSKYPKSCAKKRLHAENCLFHSERLELGGRFDLFGYEKLCDGLDNNCRHDVRQRVHRLRLWRKTGGRSNKIVNSSWIRQKVTFSLNMSVILQFTSSKFPMRIGWIAIRFWRLSSRASVHSNRTLSALSSVPESPFIVFKVSTKRETWRGGFLDW